MTDVKTAKLIYDRFEKRETPEDPLEYQRLAHDYSGDLNVNDAIGKINDVRIVGYRELDLLLGDYCSTCKLEETCDWNEKVRMAAGENYPFWLKSWPVIEFSLYEDEPYFMNGDTVMCTHYQSDELENKGIDIVEQPISRLIEIIEKKRKFTNNK